MAKNIRPYSPNQLLLLPPDLSEWLPEGHLAYFISDTVDQLELSKFYERGNQEGRGEAWYHPAMMLKVLVYGYCTGVFSSRGIAKRIEEDIAFRVLAAGNRPSHRTICRFREEHLSAFFDLFGQVVRIAQEAELVKLGVVALDGTKVKANANKHKAMSYGRMQEAEARLNQEIRELVERAREVDAREDETFGEMRGDELPQELARREKRLEVIQAAKARLEARQREKDESEGRSADDHRDASGLRPQGGRSKYRRDFGVPPDKTQDNFTDSESRIMKTSSGGFEQCYNGQIVVDAEEKIVIAAHVTQNASDVGELIPALTRVEVACGGSPEVVLADAGFRSEDNFKALEQKHITGVVALGREGKKYAEQHPQLEATRRMAERLQTPQGDSLYRRRKGIVEPVFGLIKRVLGFRTFSLRSFHKVQAEWQLVCAALNLRRMAYKISWKTT
jgi:transposase